LSRRTRGKSRIATLLGRLGKVLIQTHLLTIFAVLFVLGLVVGLVGGPDSQGTPFAELHDGMGVVSYRDAPDDSVVHFAVELSACGKIFSVYDVDERRFLPPPSGRTYGRTITGTRYAPLKVRGHVKQGFWLELPERRRDALAAGQLGEIYRTTLRYVKPVSEASRVLGMVSGYSVGYRLGTWRTSPCRESVQERIMKTPGMGEMFAREAWRRVLLEPVIIANEDDANRFAAAHGVQRLYTNFFNLALNDSDGFIPREVARLAAAGRTDEARAMHDFAGAVRRAAQEAHPSSADFVAIERWASLLDRRGHWAEGSIPPAGGERLAYLGVLTWYGLEPAAADTRRIWVGPRVLVRQGESEGFITDEIPASGVGCPLGWHEWMKNGGADTPTEAIARGWFAERPEFGALVTVGRNLARRLGHLW
jgi:hypothetical protein